MRKRTLAMTCLDFVSGSSVRGGLVLVCIVLLEPASFLNAGQVPSSYFAYTGTDVKEIPAPPPLGPANSVVVDPTFGSRILRVTDPDTRWDDLSMIPESFISTDAGSHRAWNANSTAIKLEGPHGDGYWMDFNPGAFSVGSLHPVPFGARWEWSAVDPDIIYTLHGTQIARYNKSTNVMTDLGGPPNGDAVTSLAVVVGSDNWICSTAGTGQQDSYTKIFCIRPGGFGPGKFIDVPNKTINGTPQGDPNWPTAAAGEVIGIHSIAGGAGASWLSLTFHHQSWGGNGDAVFNLATNTWSLVKDQFHGGDIYWSGHNVLGNGKFANSAGSPSGNDGRDILIRNPDNVMNAEEYLFVQQPPPPPSWCDSDHLSWVNSATDPNAPILSSRYGGSTCSFTWKGEIIAAAVDGSNTVWRFAHNFNTSKLCYFGDGFAQISNDGKWVLFSSPWAGTLGAYPGFDCPTRIDTFIMQLVPATFDNFNRPDGPLGPNWSNQSPGFTTLGEIRSNAAGTESQFPSRRAGRYTLVAFSGDHYSQVLVSVLPKWTAGAAVRMQANADSYYAAGFNNMSLSGFGEKCRIWKYLYHVAVTLAIDNSCQVKAGDTLRLEAQGPTLRFYLNGILKLTATDTSLTNGAPGFEFNHNVNDSPVLDDWFGGDLTPP